MVRDCKKNRNFADGLPIVMKRFYKFFRAFVVAAVATVVGVIVLAYVLLSLPGVQRWVCGRVEDELSSQLGAEVVIGELGIRPFNRASVRDVSVVVEGDTVAMISDLSAGIDLWRLISRGKITINYASVMGLDFRVKRDSLGSRLNIQPIIDKLSSKDESKPKSRFDLRINTIVVRESRMSYDVASEPLPAAGVFDRNHVAISSLRLDATTPRIANDRIVADLKQMDFHERSGFDLTNLTGKVTIDHSKIIWEGVELATQRSELSIADGSMIVSGKGLGVTENAEPITVGINRGSRIDGRDFAMFVPLLGEIDEPLDLEMELKVSADMVVIDRLQAYTSGSSVRIDIEDARVNHPGDPLQMRFDVPRLRIGLGNRYGKWIGLLRRIPVTLPAAIELDGQLSGTMLSGKGRVGVESPDGDIDLEASYRRPSLESDISGTIDLRIDGVEAGHIGGIADLGAVSGWARADVTLGKRNRIIDATAEISKLEYRRHNYDKIAAKAQIDGDIAHVELTSFDPAADFNIGLHGVVRADARDIDFNVDVANIDPHALNLSGNETRMSFAAKGSMNGERPDRGNAYVLVSQLRLSSAGMNDFTVDSLEIESQSAELPRRISVKSDIVNGHVEGEYDFATLAGQLRAMAEATVPAVGGDEPLNLSGSTNRFDFTFTISETDPLRDILHMPVTTLYPLTINGAVDSEQLTATLDLSAPYIRQGNKLIEDTRLDLAFDGVTRSHRMNIFTRYPSANGLTDYRIDVGGSGDNVTTDISWKIDRKRRFDGRVNMFATLSRDSRNDLAARVDVAQSELTFNDSVWTVAPSTITYADGYLDVDHLNVSRRNQFVKIDGRGSATDSDSISIDIKGFDLGYLFEAIGIDKFLLGGEATGELYATSVLSGMPHVSTEGIRVKEIAMNHCVLGDALVKSHFDMADKAVVIDGLITQANGGHSRIDGKIYPFSSELDFNITADRTRVNFLEFYMGAFASDITGHGTGDVHIFGNFKDVDVEGKVFADDLRLKLNFTNTYYHASDTVTLAPGRIDLRDITLRDPQGHTGKLNGVVTHNYFRNPTFDISVSDINGMLVYNESSRQNPDWYGRIYASGNCHVKGDDFRVKIDVDVTTADNSEFTFVLSEMEVADEYTFLTFRDKSKINEPVAVEEDVKMSAVNRMRQLVAQQPEESDTRYIIELKVDITPAIEIDLVMDPVSGDKIRSRGSGNLRMVYTSADNDLRMFGTYTLDQGFYNFTLQDIIIKDFVIKEGSTIAFTGDPLSARLNIQAYYSVNANLTDLDESFSQDKDLNRTNVPVHAILKVNGDIRQPEISFDLEFPTLTSDIDRKVRSIVSTEEMLNRQIIYLLALNRFYTPDYMSTTKGNELFSVASSTISSQLSSMLGQLSDKWMISPNLRSEKGDFSDVEVDVALSSRLLNNRLLLDGNFGYRDKSLNTNQFIGDFDIEYLLNKSGSIRLKAYNHFNDQNYYVRSATTTQGVGVMFKHDFDNIFGFLHRNKSASADTITSTTEHSSEAADSIVVGR